MEVTLAKEQNSPSQIEQTPSDEGNDGLLLGPDEFWEFDDFEQASESPNEAIVRDSIDDIWLNVLYSIHNSRYTKNRSREEQSAKLSEADEKMAEIQALFRGELALDSAERARLASLLQHVFRSALNIPTDNEIAASLIAKTTRVDGTHQARNSRHPFTEIFDQIIREVAEGWRPSGARSRREITANTMADAIYDDVERRLKEMPRPVDILKKSIKWPPAMITTRSIGRRLKSLGFPKSKV